VYAVGVSIPGCKWNAVYTTLGIGEMYPRQIMMIESRDPNIRVPVFSFEKADGGRRYHICSYAAMMAYLRSTEFKHWYSMLPPDAELHFFCDFDLSEDEIAPEHLGQRSVHGAMREFLECLDLVIARLRAKEPSWANYDGQYTVGLLYAHKTGKQSAHLVIHMSGSHMLASVKDCNHLYAMIVSESLQRHVRMEDNPMFFLDVDGSFKCIFDKTVYSPWRNFRLVGATKNKADRTKIAGGLYPACPSWSADNPGSGCTDPDCFYHVHGNFTDADFLSNEPTFIPRLASGAPGLPCPLHVPDHENPLLKKNGYRSQRDAGGASDLRSVFPVGSRGTESNGSLFSTPVSRSASLGSVMPQTPNLGRRALCLSRIADIVGYVTGHSCRIARGNNEEDPDTALVISTGNECPYAYRQKHPHVDQTVIGKMHPHKHNHVCFLVTIDLPLPRVSCRCTDPHCRQMLEVRKCYVPLDIASVTAELAQAYLTAAEEYLREDDIPMLTLYSSNE
jgi:hypothetical protein